MGTNFYINDSNLTRDESHIGKRSAAGWYCWDCNRTLCKEGEGKVHYRCKNIRFDQTKIEKECFGFLSDCDGGHWFKECPDCGKKIPEENWLNSSVGRELGFNKNKYEEKIGVASCCSFAWAIKKYEFLEKINHLKIKHPIKNEYDDLFTFEEFLNVLKECPIQHYRFVNIVFS